VSSFWSAGRFDVGAGKSAVIVKFGRAVQPLLLAFDVFQPPLAVIKGREILI